MPRLALAWLLGALISFPLDVVRAAPPRIRIATIAPKGTSYDKVLRIMANHWQKVSEGQYRVTVFSGGVQGGESAMVDRMRINQIQAGLLTAMGLSKAVPEVQGLQSIPMLFRSLEEVDYVNQQLHERLERTLASKGFVVLFWSDAGWVRFFSRKPMKTPEDLRKLKLFAWSGDLAAEKIYRRFGFHPVPLETGEILTGLKTGLIDTVALPPFAANANQVFREAPYMLNLNWAPLVGALVINKKTWDQIPPKLQERFRKSAVGAGRLIKAYGRKEAGDAVKAMQRRWGLKVQEISPKDRLAWQKAAQDAYPFIRGMLVPEDIFDQVIAILDAYRKGR